jgi:hypothetical protein
MKFHAPSRRMFLTGGGRLLSLPVLTSLLPRRVEAQMQAGPPPLRFIMVASYYSPNELCYYGQLAGQQAALQKANGNALIPMVSYLPLSQLNGDISYVLAPLSGLKSKFSLIHGLDVTGAEGAAHPFSFPSCNAGQDGSTKYNNSHQPSVDCVIAASDKVYPRSMPANRRYVVAAPMYSSGFSASYDLNPAYTPGMSERERVTLVTPIRDTEVLWQRFVSLYKPAAGAAPMTRGDVLNPVIADYRKVAADRRLGAEDRAKLEAYIALIADIQRDMAAGAALGTCVAPPRDAEMPPPPAPAVGGKMAGEGDGSFLARSLDALNRTNEWRGQARALEDIRIRNHMRIVAAAMACDLTRVASFGFGFDGQGDLSHSYDHDGGAYRHKPDTNAYSQAFYDQHRRAAAHVAELIQLVDGIKEGGQSMLSSSIVYWAQQYGTIVSPGGGHSSTGMPVVLAGGGGGKLNPGYYVDYRRGTYGLPLSNLLVTFMNCFGLGSTDYETRPGEGYGGYDGPRATLMPDDLKSTAARRTALPFLYKGPPLG